MSDLSFEAWLDRVAALVTGYKDGADLADDTGPECWRAYYDDDYSPEAAWAEECSYD